VLVLALFRPHTGRVDRYEPLPGIAALPAWLWRRTNRWTRLAVVAALLVVAVAAAVVVPAQRADSQRRADAAEQAHAAAAERRALSIQADQRPRRGRTEPSASLAARTRALADLRSAIRADARRRVTGAIAAIECERFPRADEALPPERDLSVRNGRYACLAVTERFEGGALGHPYRAQIDFATGRYAYCKVTGSPDLVRDPRLATPRACGG
jgi:type II secretory pathway pseudopilin PulG